jgi:hypothetical protein
MKSHTKWRVEARDRRRGVVGGVGTAVILLFATWGVARAQDIPANDLASERGVTQVQRPGQSLHHGRVGSQPSVSSEPSIWRGLLVDASCRDRSLVNLREPPLLGPAVPVDPASADAADTSTGAASRNGAVSSHGISVDAKTAQAERDSAMRVHTEDHLTRQRSPACAIDGETAHYALLLPDGTLLNLDEGGNTKAFEAFQSSRTGQAILNGKAYGEKPQAVVQGVRDGDQLMVVKIRLG